jgi:hypothetical protein
MSLEDKMDILAVIAQYSYTYAGREADGLLNSSLPAGFLR